jgi:arsenite methyltransferase
MTPAEEFKDTPEVVSAYDEVPLWSAAFGQLLLRELPMEKNQRVLDLGCGTGFPALELAERLGPTCQVVAMDPWLNALDRARTKNLVYKIPNVEFLQGKGEEMPFGDLEFDLIVCNLGLNNWDQPAKILSECARVLKTGGLFCLTTNPLGHWGEFYAAVRRVLSRLGDKEAMARFDRQEAHRLPYDTARSLFEKVGFSLARRVQDNLVFRYNDASSFLDHHFVGWGFKSGWQGALGKELWDEIVPEIVRELDAAPRDKGALSLIVPMEYWEFRKE